MDVVTLAAAKSAAKSMIEEATGDLAPIKILDDTLETGDTELVFTDDDIATAVRCEVYTDDVYLQPVAMERVGTSLTITFVEQEVDVDVYVYLYSY